MPIYEICYLDTEDTLLGTFCIPCTSDKEAKIMAHAMRVSGAKRMEVWKGATLVYERPQTHLIRRSDALPLHAA